MSHLFDNIGPIWLDNARYFATFYLAFTVGLWFLIWVVLAPWLRERKIRSESPGLRQMASEIFCSLRTILVFATVTIVTHLMFRLGLYPLVKIGDGLGPVWFWASLGLMILAHDGYFYWVHRAMHLPQFFRHVHRRHHLSHNPSPFTAYSFDLWEAVLMASFVVIWPLFTPTPTGVVNLFMLHQIARNTLLHTGYELMPIRADGRPWLDMMTTTTHHDQHHGRGGNYGLYFTWWDRWMKTERHDYHDALARFAPTRRPRTRG